MKYCKALDIKIDYSNNWYFYLRIALNVFWIGKWFIMIRIFNMIYARGKYDGVNIRETVKTTPLPPGTKRPKII